MWQESIRALHHHHSRALMQNVLLGRFAASQFRCDELQYFFSIFHLFTFFLLFFYFFFPPHDTPRKAFMIINAVSGRSYSLTVLTCIVWYLKSQGLLYIIFFVRFLLKCSSYLRGTFRSCYLSYCNR